MGGQLSAITFLLARSSATTRTAAMEARQCVFAAAIVARRCDHVAAAVAGFIGVEVIELLGATLWHRAMVSVVRIVAVIDVTMEARGPMEPWSSSKEDAADKPVRPIVPIRSAIVRCVIKIPIRADRRRPDIYSNGNL